MDKDKGIEKINKLITDIDKAFGKGSVTNMEEKVDGIEFISSGILSLDLALGGGYAKGRVVEIYGPESSGKTTLAIYAMISAQKDGGVVGFIDAEHAFDIYYARGLGLKTGKEDWLISQPGSGEEALEITERFVRSGIFTVIVIDSVAALTPKAEIEGEMGDSKMGLQARLMSQAMRKLASVIGKTDTIVIFINQLREKIGVMFGNPEVTTGGNALKYYASQRLDIRRIGVNKDGDEVISNKTRVKVTKSKVAPPYKKAEFNISFGTGVSKEGDLLNLAVDYGFVNKSGSWFSYEEVKLGQGFDGVVKLLEDNPELFEEIENKVKEELGL